MTFGYSAAMSLAKPAVVCALMAALLSGCGTATKPLAGTSHLTAETGFYGAAVSERPPRANCLSEHHLPVDLYRTADQLPAIRVGSGPAAPTMIFEPTGGYAEGLKITGQAQGAELIGSVLLYPNGMSLSEAKVVEQCAATGGG